MRKIPLFIKACLLLLVMLELYFYLIFGETLGDKLR